MAVTHEVWTVKDAATAWGVAEDTVRNDIRKGRITDAQMDIIAGKAT
ncbi:MAG: hypothetical protein PHO66_00905 [Eubacteriales bacterium]|nr:hypothetical protein [Eubacteriales bacterium]